MLTPERRHIQRMATERLAYIHIEPNNGGIVLNVSGEGLCFHSMAPVERKEPLRFSLLEQNRRIDACGELIWTDEVQKVGGVRFTTLTAEARQEIHNWISQPVVPLKERKASTLGFAFLRASPGLDTLRFDRKTDSGECSAFAAALLKVKARMKLSAFSGGLATGFLLSALAVSVFFFYAHRRQFGESLIHLGERLAAKPKVERQTALPSPQGVSPPKEAVSMVGAQLPVRAQIPAERPKNLLTPLLASQGKQQVTLKPQISASTAFRAADGPLLQHSTVRGTAEMTPAAPPATSLGVPSVPAANVIPNKPASPASVEIANAGPVRDSSQESAVSPSQMYFDLGRFKDELWAHNISDKLAKLGLRAKVIQRGHLWMNSYQVLVGPYSNEEDAKRIHKDLVSQGYKPRAFERGSRNFIFGSAVTLNGTRLPVGDFTISWESYVTKANVKFAQRSYVLATADGRWIKQPWRYQHNEIVYVKSSNGSRILIEIHFSGLDRALVFRHSS